MLLPRDDRAEAAIGPDKGAGRGTEGSHVKGRTAAHSAEIRRDLGREGALDRPISLAGLNDLSAVGPSPRYRGQLRPLREQDPGQYRRDPWVLPLRIINPMDHGYSSISAG